VRIEFTFSRDADYFRRQLSPAAWSRTRALRIFAWFVIPAGAVLTAVYHEKAAGPVLGCGLILAGVVSLLVRRRRIAEMVTVPVDWHSPRRWSLTADGLESATELTSVTHAWSTFRAAEVCDNAYLLIQDGPVIVDIPRLPLTAEQDAEVTTFLQERGILGAAGR
jgi:hypothetical protein